MTNILVEILSNNLAIFQRLILLLFPSLLSPLTDLSDSDIYIHALGSFLIWLGVKFVWFIYYKLIYKIKILKWDLEI